MASSSPPISYKLTKLIACGAQGKVYLASRTDLPSNRSENDENIAVKKFILSIDPIQNKEQMDALNLHIPGILALNHPNIVRHFFAEIVPLSGPLDEPTYDILMEYCAGGTLEDAVKRTWLPPPLLQRWITQILQGLAYLHDDQQRIVHRDIKGDNILLTITDIEKCSLKIADLGNVKRLLMKVTQPREVSHSKGTSKFMSPEMVEAYSGEVHIGRKTDIWSLGCVVIQMVTGRAPTYSNIIDGVRRPLTGQAPVMQFVYAGGSPEFPEGLPEELETFIKTCLQRIPADRPTAVQLLKHPLITGNAQDWSYPKRGFSDIPTGT